MLTLYHTSHCPNCQAQEKILQQLQTQNADLEYKSINLEHSPEQDLTPGIRSVPTLLINQYRFEGLMSATEIQQWLATGNHDKDYVNHLLKSGQLDFALQWLTQNPSSLGCLVELLNDDDIEMGVRIGLDAMFEQLAATGQLTSLTQPLGQSLASIADSQRIDVLHYLAMIHTAAARQYIEHCITQTTHPEVQRVARELLEEWQDSAETVTTGSAKK